MRNPFKASLEDLLIRPRPNGRKSANLTPDGLRITEFPAPVTRILRLYYGAGGSYSQLYASQQNVRTVVEDLSREAAELTLKMYLKDPRGEDLPSGRHEVDHPMMELFAEPQPGLSLYSFWFSLFADISIFDIAHWQLVKNGKTTPQAITRIPVPNITPDVDPNTGLVRQWRMFDGTYRSTEEIVTFWGYDPAVVQGKISPMETLRRILAEDFASGQDREGRWNNGLRKDGLVEQAVDAPPMSDEALESFLVDAEDALSGAQGSGRPWVLQPGMSYKDTQWSPKEMEYLEGRKLNRTEVAAAFHYPAAKVLAGDAEPTPETLNYFYTSTLPPYLTRVEREIEAQVLPKFELVSKTRRTFYVEFNLDAKLRGSFEQQAAIMATTAGGPVITVNEARARLNLPPIKDGDLIFIPLNSMRAGGPQGSPQAPTDTPAPGVNPAGTTPTPNGNGNGNGAVTRAAASDTGPFLVLGGDVKQLLAPDVAVGTVEDVLQLHDLKVAMAKGQDEFVAFMRRMRDRFEHRHAETLARFFARMLNAVLGGKPANTPRWDKELTDDLFGVSLQVAEAVGSDVAKRLDGGWSTERTASYLKEHAEHTAKLINSQTIKMLDDGADHDVIFGQGRVDTLSTGLTTSSMSWSVNEAVHQNDADARVRKTWHTTSDDPRGSHAALNDMTIGFDDRFGNGLEFPGDGASDPTGAETVFCQCVMTVSAVTD